MALCVNSGQALEGNKVKHSIGWYCGKCHTIQRGLQGLYVQHGTSFKPLKVGLGIDPDSIKDYACSCGGELEWEFNGSYDSVYVSSACKICRLTWSASSGTLTVSEPDDYYQDKLEEFTDVYGLP